MHFIPIIILFGKPLVFWIGFLALFSLSFQIYLGVKLTKGQKDLLRLHKINAGILAGIVIFHLLLGLSLYL